VSNIINRQDPGTPPSLDSKTLSTTEYHLSTRGYAVIEGFLSPARVSELKTIMLDAVDRFRPREGIVQSFNDKYQIHDLLVQSRTYCALLEDYRLQQVMAPHLGDHWIMYAATSSSIPPRGTNYSSRIHVDSPRFHAGYAFNMGVIWTLDEYTENNGCLEVLPGSHHSPETPNAEIFEAASVKVLCGAGALIVFNARLFHRTSVNETAFWRHAMTMNSCRSFMKPRLDWVRMVPEAIAQDLSLQARRILGFDTRVPTSLDEFFRPDSERLYKPGQG